MSGVSSLAGTIGFWLLAAVIGWLGVRLVHDAGNDAGNDAGGAAAAAGAS